MKIKDALFYLEEIPDIGTVQEISGLEASHALRSRRMSVGAILYLTDGRGRSARACILAVEPRLNSFEVRIDEIATAPFPVPKQVLACAIPKGDRQAVMLAMAVQLGMNSYIPLECDFSATCYREGMEKRWKRIVYQSAKQCRQVHIPTIGGPLTLDRLLSDRRTRVSDGKCLLVLGDPDGERACADMTVNAGEMEELILITGPEGGLSAREKNLIEQENVIKLRLSNLVLRSETAALALLAAVNQLI